MEVAESVLTSLNAIVTNVIMDSSWEDIISLSLQLNRNDDIYYFCQYSYFTHNYTRSQTFFSQFSHAAYNNTV